MLSWFFLSLSVLDETSGTNAVILPKNEANQWQRAGPRESHRKKFSTLKNYYTKNPTCPLHSRSLGQSEQSFRFVCAQSPSYVQLFTTLWIAAHQAPLSMGFPRQECWNRLPCSHPGDLPDPGICYSQSKTSLIPAPHFPGHCTFDSQPKFSLEIIISIF